MLNSVEAHDPDRGAWQAMPPVLHALQFPGVLVCDGGLLVLDGFDGGGRLLRKWKNVMWMHIGGTLFIVWDKADVPRQCLYPDGCGCSERVGGVRADGCKWCGRCALPFVRQSFRQASVFPPEGGGNVCDPSTAIANGFPGCQPSVLFQSFNCVEGQVRMPVALLAVPET